MGGSGEQSGRTRGGDHKIKNKKYKIINKITAEPDTNLWNHGRAGRKKVPFKKQLLKATKQALAIEANADCPYFPGRAIHKVNVGVPTRQGVPTSGSI